MTTDEIMALTRDDEFPSSSIPTSCWTVIVGGSQWADWSMRKLAEAARTSRLVINSVIFAEISIGFARIEDAEAAIAVTYLAHDRPICAGGRLSRGQGYLAYRKRVGAALGRFGIFDPGKPDRNLAKMTELMTRREVRAASASLRIDRRPLRAANDDVQQDVGSRRDGTHSSLVRAMISSVVIVTLLRNLRR